MFVDWLVAGQRLSGPHAPHLQPLVWRPEDGPEKIHDELKLTNSVIQDRTTALSRQLQILYPTTHLED